jgi:hypothetical protein
MIASAARRRPNALHLLTALAVLVLTRPAAAFQPLITDDTGTQGAGGNQIEFLVERERTRAGAQAAQSTTLPLVFTRGLTDTLDVSAGISRVRARDSSAGLNANGAGNPVLGAKWRFLEYETSRTSFALKPELLLPVSEAGEANGLGTGKLSWALTLIATREVAFGAVHANLAAGRLRFRYPASPASTTLSLSIAPVWDIAPGWKLALDLGYASEGAGGVTTRSRFVGFGAIYSPSEDLDFALGAFRTTTSSEPRARTDLATAGITWRFR